LFQVNCKCAFACRTLRLDYIRELFHKFYELGDYNKQQNYLQSLVHPQLIKRRRHGNYDHPSESRRQHTFTYLLPLQGGSEAKVCLKTFYKTFGITPKRVQILTKKILEGTMDCSDKRGGQRTNEKKLEWTQKVIDHIKSFPVEESHYGRAKAKDKKFLSPDLNISRMYRSFLEKHSEEFLFGDPPITRQWYNEIFLTKFNLSFHRPRVDTCSTCDQLNLKVQSGDLAAKVQQELHHRRAEATTTAMSNDIKNAKDSDAHVLSIDLQQQMYLPQLTHTEMYYSQQLACCNLGIHDSTANKGFMFLWSENHGGRGSLEISSCVYQYLNTQCNTEKRKLIVWSDNCSGQNKNQYMITMYLFLIAAGKFDEIIHKFPIKGHTFLPCDRDFALIEKRRSKCSPNTVMDLVEIITSAAQKNPFTCTVVEQFYNFRDISHKFLDTKKLGISKASQLRLTLADFGDVMVTRGGSEAAAWSDPIKVLKKSVTIDDFKSLQLPLMRTKWGIPQKKKQDIIKMLPYLRPEPRAYFEEILAETPPDNEGTPPDNEETPPDNEETPPDNDTIP
jgi:hypothetical protein